MYLGRINTQTATILDEKRVVHVHPGDLKLLNEGSLTRWIENYNQSREERQLSGQVKQNSISSSIVPLHNRKARSLNANSKHSRASAQVQLVPHWTSDSSDSESTDTYVRITRARTQAARAVPQASAYHPAGDSDAQIDDGQVASAGTQQECDSSGVQMSGGESMSSSREDERSSTSRGERTHTRGESTHTRGERTHTRGERTHTRGESSTQAGDIVNSPRGLVDDRNYALIVGHDQLLYAARILKERAKTVDVSWLEQDDNLEWNASSLGHSISIPRIHNRFALVNSSIPTDIVERIGTRVETSESESEEGPTGLALYTCAVSTPKGGAMQRPAAPAEVSEGQYDLAMLKEWLLVLRNKVLGKQVGNERRAMSTKWHLTEKEDAATGLRRHKARLVAKGFMDPHVGETFVNTPSKHSLLIATTYIVSQPDWDIKMLDVKSAFLQAELTQEDQAVVRLSGYRPKLPEMCPFSEIDQDEYEVLKSRDASIEWDKKYVLEKALYGYKKAPLKWEETLAKELREKEFVEADSGIWVAHNTTNQVRSVIICHSDDMLIGEGKGVHTEKDLAAKFECNEPAVLKDGQSFKFVGIEFTKNCASVSLSLHHYLDNVPLSDSRIKRVKESDLAPGEESEIRKDLAPEYMSKVGCFGWATRLDPSKDVWLSSLATNSQSPTQKHMHALDNALAALKRNPRPLRLEGVNGPPKIVVYSDASYSLKTHQSRAGYKVYIHGHGQELDECNAVAWCSRRIKRLLDSSTSAELMGLKLAVKHLFSYKALIESLWLEEVEIDFRIDSMALYNQVRTGKCQEERSMQAELDYTLQEMQRLRCKSKWIPRAEQKADDMTKLVWYDA
eukprot:GHVU01137974.1.p1 GENE.GHVU01137974.1~~GHVU01137974.1.p1  ORF type:complete len:849 (+),score=82.46 GHVU01137974.1:374-2920(+)